MANTHLSVCKNIILEPSQTTAYSPILRLDPNDVSNVAIIYNISLCNSSFYLKPSNSTAEFSRTIFADIYVQPSGDSNKYYIAKNIKLQTHFDAASFQFSDPITLVKDSNATTANSISVEIRTTDVSSFSACSVYIAFMES